VLDFLNRNGVNGKFFPEITSGILYNDPYMVLADFQDYHNAQQRIVELWNDKKKFAQMSLMNTANAGIFAADRSIREYAENIWHTKSAFKK
jgi:starch phosphorylase